MKKIIKRVALGFVALVVLSAVAFGIFVGVQASAFDASMAKVYDDKPLDNIARSSDPAVIARGKHVVDAVAGCSSKDCHGADLAGGNTLVMGPLGKLTGPNITSKGLGGVYTDGELARVIRHGIKKDGRSALFMPSQDFNWLPDSDLVAVVSYLRSAPGVDKPNGPMEFGSFGKVLDRQDKFVADVARRIDHAHVTIAPPPSPTAEYGKFLAKGCTGCHGERLSGGRIPGTPSSVPVPLNLTPHETGMKGWTYEDLDKLLTTGARKNGKQLDPFMPIENYKGLDETEKKALYAYLSGLAPLPLGGR